MNPVKHSACKGTIVYFTEGNSQNLPLVFLPGFTGTHGDLLDLARFFKDKYFVILPEFPGWGDSKKSNSLFTVSSYANFLKDLIKDLNLKKVTIIAHCMGATVALETAYIYPKSIKELFLMSVPYQEGTPGQVFFNILTKLSENAPSFLRPVFFFWRSRVITIPMSFFVLKTRTFRSRLHLINKTLHQQGRQDEHVLETNWNSLIEYDYEKLKKLSIPIHLFHGKDDLLISLSQSEKFSKILSSCTLDILPNIGHLPPVETPKTVAYAIKKYLVS